MGTNLDMLSQDKRKNTARKEGNTAGRQENNEDKQRRDMKLFLNFKRNYSHLRIYQ